MDSHELLVHCLNRLWKVPRLLDLLPKQFNAFKLVQYKIDNSLVDFGQSWEWTDGLKHNDNYLIDMLLVVLHDKKTAQSLTGILLPVHSLSFSYLCLIVNYPPQQSGDAKQASAFVRVLDQVICLQDSSFWQSWSWSLYTSSSYIQHQLFSSMNQMLTWYVPVWVFFIRLLSGVHDDWNTLYTTMYGSM